MEPTSVSLLECLRRGPDAGRLVELYEPFIRRCLGRDPALRNDADDLTQDVLAILVRKLPEFERRRDGSFRAWLRVVTGNRIRQWWRERHGPAADDGGSAARLEIADLADPASAPSRRWDEEHDRHVLGRLMELVEPEFSGPVWRAFVRLALDGAGAAEVAAELGSTENAVLLSKSRVLRRLREEAAGLID